MYINPGQLFIDKHGQVEGVEDIYHFATFLREEAGIGHDPPIDLSRIYRRFEISTPQRVPLAGQQGLLISADFGIILIEERDVLTRQKFSEAHELMELLFAVIPIREGDLARNAGNFKHHVKERLCNQGAAELIMPEASFLPRIRRSGISYETARQLASEYDVSLSASLVHMVHIGPGRHAIVLWKMKNKPAEIRNEIPEDQLSFLDEPFSRVAPKKLRVEWSFVGANIPYIPVNKSVPGDSSVYKAWQEGVFTIGYDNLTLGSVSGVFQCENYPFEITNERFVLTLMHLPGDYGCQPA